MKAFTILSLAMIWLLSFGCTTPQQKPNQPFDDLGKMSFLIQRESARTVSSSPNSEPPNPEIYLHKIGECFNDDSLEEVLKLKKQGLIYIADVQMPLSLLTLEHIKRVAQNNNLPLVILFSGQDLAGIEMAKTIIRDTEYVGKNSVPLRNCSDRLIMAGGPSHRS